jgi:1-acyl-sn-glycerol-3-phosphate acyltransferase
MTTGPERVSLTYRVVMAVARPIVGTWGRLEVVGGEHLPRTGPVLIFANHDSAWDPLVVGVASMPHRQVRALAKSSLWKYRPVAWVLDHMGQIPIDRGRADLQAMSAAIDQLHAGACIGVFPEGTVSRGRPLRAMSGAGRLAVTVPESQLVCVAITGSVDVVRFPKRPRIRVEFFEPADGQRQPEESAIKLTRRTMGEVRSRAPYAIPGRSKKAAHYRALAEAESPAAADKKTSA